jgi:protein EFR3
MHIENLSLASLNRPARGVGVTELREALSGRSSMSQSALVNRAPSFSTLEHASSLTPDGNLTLTRTRSRPQKKPIAAAPGEVRDVLNKLGLGKATSNGLLKVPFNARSPEKKTYVCITVFVGILD